MTVQERDAAARAADGHDDRSADSRRAISSIEAVVEDLAVKESVFRRARRASFGRTPMLATNTSALSVTQVAAATTHPERVVGLHFFNPAPVLPLVEVVRTELTSERGVRGRLRVRRADRQDADRLRRHAGLRRQPDPDPGAERRRPRSRRGNGEPRGHRPCDAARHELADRPARAHRPDRRGRARPRGGGALGGLPGASLRSAGATGPDAGGRASGP